MSLPKPYYEEDGIRIFLGDCREILPELKDESIDLILTDPPYGIGYQSNMRTATKKFNKITNDDNNTRFSAYPLLYRLLKNNSCGVFFCSFKNYAVDYLELNKVFDIKNCIVWDKGGGGIGDLKHTLSTDYELAIIGHKGNFEIVGKRIGSVWEIPKVFPSDMTHPTEKPAELFTKMINVFATSDCLVLDPYMGSGTTLVAAKLLGRRAIGIEISEEYCAIAVDRLRQEVLKFD